MEECLILLMNTPFGNKHKRRRTEEAISRRHMGEVISRRRMEEDINRHMEAVHIMAVPRLHHRQPLFHKNQLAYMRLTQEELGTACTVIPIFG